MNSQFLPPQPMGNPSQGFQQTPPQGFQNVSLVAPPKNEGGLPQMGGPGLQPQQFPQSSGNMTQPPRQFMPGQMPPQFPTSHLPASHLPPSQLPPSQRPPNQNFNMGSKMGENGSPAFLNGPPQSVQPPKSAFSSVPPTSGPPRGQQGLPRPSSNPTVAQQGVNLQSVSQTDLDTLNQRPPPNNMSGNQPPPSFSNMPPSSQTSQGGLPPSASQIGQLPQSSASQVILPPPTSLNSGPPSHGGLTNGSAPPVSMPPTSTSTSNPQGRMPTLSQGNPPPMGGQSQQSGLPPPGSQEKMPPISQGNPPPIGGQSQQSGLPPPGSFPEGNLQGRIPPVSQGNPPSIGGQSQQLPGSFPEGNLQGRMAPVSQGNQSSVGGQNQQSGLPPPGSFPEGNLQGRMPPVSSGNPPPIGGQNQQSGLPPPGSFPGQQPGQGGVFRSPGSGAQAAPPHMGQRPPQNYPSITGQPSPRNQPFPPGGNFPPSSGVLPPGGRPGGNFPPPPGVLQPGGQPPSAGGQFPPPQGGQFVQAPPGRVIQPPGNQFGPPGGQYPPPQPGNYGQPPLPGQMHGSSQLSNQMQNMNLGGPRQYPKNIMNGENGPHMPPPLNQQNYLNSQQPPMGRAPAPGYPPMPQPPAGGAYQSGPVGGAYPQQQSYQQQQQQQRKLDPDQMPNPIQVTQDDHMSRSGPFVTNQKGLMPPLVTTHFVVQDQGNASPRFIRSTMYNVPITQDIMKQTAVPFALAISPMARTLEEEYPPPIVNFGSLGPVRCIRCKAYMCPYMQFIDSGRRFQCLFCKATTDVPDEYFQHLDHTGQRMDRFERPELVLGTYEFVATSDYCRNNALPKPPAFIFVIDVSYNNIKSGMVQLLCSQMKEILKNLPIDQGSDKSNMRVGFITYNSSVHFYNIKGTLAAPQMMVVGDTQEMFMPLLDGFLSTPEESESIIDDLMEQIPIMFGETKETETVLLPAILGGLEALKASECTGKLLVFHSTLPTAEAPGKLKNRDDRKLLGTDKERTVLTPQTQAYNQLGQDCVQAGCSVDLFVFNNSFIDVATIGQVARLSGGEVFKYTYFQADSDGDRLIRDVIMDLSRPIAFDSIMRVRTSTGVRPTDFYGHFFMSNTTDMELASIDCDKSVAVEIKHDDKLSEEEGVYIQAALLYTSCSGQRRLRIINLSLKTCSQMADLYRSCDLDTLINYIAKQSTFKLLENNPKAVKDAIVNRAAQILASYRKHCATPSSAGQLILPECMKLLPLYTSCLLKSDALSGGSDMSIDDRAFVMMAVMTMDVRQSVNYFYPRLIPLHDIDISNEEFDIPAPIRCSIEKMSDVGVYLLENGIHMFLWVGLGASPDFTQKVFGAPSAIQVDIERTSLPELDNPLSIAVRNIIDEIRMERHRCMRLTIVRQREKLEPLFKNFLVEDRGADGSANYVDFLCHMHREVRNILS